MLGFILFKSKKKRTYTNFYLSNKNNHKYVYFKIKRNNFDFNMLF